MKIGFCGHSYLINKKEIRDEILSFLQTLDPQLKYSFFLGGYGDFDSASFSACKEYKQKCNSQSSLCFISPYNSEKFFQSRKLHLIEYDEIIYPELEKVPPRYAIMQRNRWIARNCDLLICYIDHTWGGAYYTYSEAMKRNFKILNLAKEKPTQG